MERRLNISVLNTESRSKGFFSRSYTVKIIQVYHIKISVDFIENFFSYKRFSELFEFSQYLFPYIKKYRLLVPSFPKKQFSISKEKIETRRKEIQEWFQVLTCCPKLNKKICRFFSINFQKFLDISPELHEDDFYLREFVELFENNPNQKLSILKLFSMKFLARKRKVNSESIKKLLNSLVPLCGKEIFSGFILDLLHKMMRREYFASFEEVIKEFSSLPAETLRQMKMDRILSERKLGNNLVYEILKILENFDHNISILEIVISIQLNRNSQAFGVYQNWFSESVVINTKPATLVDTLWTELYSNDKLKISFRYSPAQLDIDISLNIISNRALLIDLITSPYERPRWDKKIKSMKVEANKYTIELYQKKKTFKVCSEFGVDLFDSHSKIIFNDLNQSGLTSHFCIESDCLEKGDMLIGSENKTCASGLSSQLEEDLERFKVLARISCKDSAVALYRDDILHESNELVKSFKCFVSMSENQEVGEDDKTDRYLDMACARKNLNKSVLF